MSQVQKPNWSVMNRQMKGRNIEWKHKNDQKVHGVTCALLPRRKYKSNHKTQRIKIIVQYYPFGYHHVHVAAFIHINPRAKESGVLRPLFSWPASQPYVINTVLTNESTSNITRVWIYITRKRKLWMLIPRTNPIFHIRPDKKTYVK